MTEASTNLSTNLRRARSEAGLTLEQVAEALDTSYPTIWRYEAGQRNQSGPTLFLMAQLYGKTVEWLFDQHEPVQPDTIPAGDPESGHTQQSPAPIPDEPDQRQPARRYRWPESGKRFKVPREEKNLTQREAAQTLGVSTQSVWYWESGRSQPLHTDWQMWRDFTA